jgi:molecular chaperone GrpE
MPEEKSSTELENLKALSEEYLAGWKRAKADYENLAKETERRTQNLVKFANENLLSAIIPIIDQFELALEHTPDITEFSEAEQKRLKNWIIGLHAVKAIWEAAFREMGLEQVATDGAFDPSVHEAVSREASEIVPTEHIIRVEQPGYLLNGKLLRPAKVVVSN